MRILSGIQPSGSLHIGNYFGMMRPMIAYQEESELYCFIVNYHAMTSVTDGKQLAKGTVDAAMDFLALGLDPVQAIFWVQSDVPEVAELTWILNNVTPVGLLLRSHSYKDKIAQGLSPNHGLLSYPVLMAADILLYQSEKVPVGQDQQQHLEIARDIAIKFNHLFGETFVIPEAEINPNIPTVLGLDGRKMSKSYDNTIEIFTAEDGLRKKIAAIGIMFLLSIPALVVVLPEVIKRFESAPVESGESRHTANLASADMGDDYFFGVGLNNYSYAINYMPYGEDLSDLDRGIAHHIFWLHYAELGILGVILFVLMTGTFMWVALRFILQRRDGLERVFAIGVLAAFVVNWLIGTLEWNFRIIQITIIYFMLAGFVSSLDRVERQRIKNRKNIRPRMMPRRGRTALPVPQRQLHSHQRSRHLHARDSQSSVLKEPYAARKFKPRR